MNVVSYLIWVLKLTKQSNNVTNFLVFCSFHWIWVPLTNLGCNCFVCSMRNVHCSDPQPNFMKVQNPKISTVTASLQKGRRAQVSTAFIQQGLQLYRQLVDISPIQNCKIYIKSKAGPPFIYCKSYAKFWTKDIHIPFKTCLIGFILFTS